MATIDLTAPLSGAIGMGNIRDVFGDDIVSLNQLYRGGGRVDNITENNGVPTSGQIGLGSLYGVRNRIVIPDLEDSDQQMGFGGGNAFVSWTTSMNKPGRIRYTQQGASFASGPVAEGTWLDRAANTGFTVNLEAIAPGGGQGTRGGTVTFTYALPGRSTAFHTILVSWTARWGLIE